MSADDAAAFCLHPNATRSDQGDRVTVSCPGCPAKATVMVARDVGRIEVTLGPWLRHEEVMRRRIDELPDSRITINVHPVAGSPEVDAAFAQRVLAEYRSRRG